MKSIVTHALAFLTGIASVFAVAGIAVYLDGPAKGVIKPIMIPVNTGDIEIMPVDINGQYRGVKIAVPFIGNAENLLELSEICDMSSPGLSYFVKINERATIWEDIDYDGKWDRRYIAEDDRTRAWIRLGEDWVEVEAAEKSGVQIEGGTKMRWSTDQKAWVEQ